MRSRSGAFHAQTEESFIELAQASQYSTGIFYDERINRRIMKEIHLNTNPQSISPSKTTKDSSIETPKQENLFQGFDFRLEFQVEKQEREQLERMKVKPLKQINIGIITNHPRQIVQSLSKILQVPAPIEALSRGVNLVIFERDQFISKYWIFQQDSLKSGDILIQLYLKHCSLLFGIDEFDFQLKTLKSGSIQTPSWIKENIKALLN